MIEPDKYAEEYFNLKYPNLLKEQITKIYNFNKLSSDKKIVFIKLDVALNNKLTIIERFDWDLSDEKKSPEKFAEIFIENLKDLIENDLLTYNKKKISNQIYTQILEHFDKNTVFTKLKISKKDNEMSTINSTQNSINNIPNIISQNFNNNFYCNNCNIYLHNSEICFNCSGVAEKKSDKIIFQSQSSINGNSSANNNGIINNNNQEEILRQTERQKILEAKQKNINLTESVAISYTNDKKEKKICKKCGEVNTRSAAECRDCKHKFPLVTHFDINVDQTFSVHFWDKISKNTTIQQLKNFADYFILEDFSSLKYLYERVKTTIKQEFEDILTDEAIHDLNNCLEKAYFSLSNPTLTVINFFNFIIKIFRPRKYLRILT